MDKVILQNTASTTSTPSELDLQGPSQGDHDSEQTVHASALEIQARNTLLKSYKTRGAYLNRRNNPPTFWGDGFYSGEVIKVRPVDVSGRARTPYRTVEFKFAVHSPTDEVIAILDYECPIDWTQGSQLRWIAEAVLDCDLQHHERDGGISSNHLLGRHCFLDLARTAEGIRTGVFDVAIRAIVSQSNYVKAYHSNGGQQSETAFAA